ncbi:MAG: hypothetical protein ACE5LC_09315 [Candidatus Aminicenantales bacterium]
MKKAVASSLVVVLFFSVIFFSANLLRADVDKCYNQYERCRHRALTSGQGIIRQTLMLTICDYMLFLCLVAAAQKN